MLSHYGSGHLFLMVETFPFWKWGMMRGVLTHVDSQWALNIVDLPKGSATCISNYDEHLLPWVHFYFW